MPVLSRITLFSLILALSCSQVCHGQEENLLEDPSKEESPIAPPGEVRAGAVRCPECGYRNMPAWKTCYACGTPLEIKKAVAAGIRSS